MSATKSSSNDDKHPYLRDGLFAQLWPLKPTASEAYKKRHAELCREDSQKRMYDGIQLAKFR